MDEIKHLDEKIISIQDAVSGEWCNYEIIVGAILWDTVEKVYALQLMKDECSRCEGTYGKQDKTPSFLYSASTLDHEHSETFTRRDV